MHLGFDFKLLDVSLFVITYDLTLNVECLFIFKVNYLEKVVSNQSQIYVRDLLMNQLEHIEYNVTFSDPQQILLVINKIFV